MTRATVVISAVGFAAALIPGTVCAQHDKVDDPIPADAKGTVLPISGEVRTILGLSSAVAGRTEVLAAALAALGARSTPTEIRIAMSADVLFDFDKADLKREAAPTLQKVVTVLASYPQARVTIDGYTDAKGEDTYNQALSERRAESVSRWLAAQPGLATIQFSTRGWGARNPVAPNRNVDSSDNPAGRQKNRRVEIVVKTG